MQFAMEHDKEGLIFLDLLIEKTQKSHLKHAAL